ncbi:Odorant receptor 106, partial [Halyomorpha halys]
AEQVVLAIYNIPWYQMSKRNADMLRLMLLMARNPVKVTAFRAPTFLLNKETFISFIVNTITALMTFSKMNDRRQS